MLRTIASRSSPALTRCCCSESISSIRTFSSYTTRLNVTTSSSPIGDSPISQNSSPHRIPVPAPAPILFPSLENISQNDLILHKKNASAVDGVFYPLDKSGWYKVSRTKANQLPVYSDVRGNGHRVTVIRRIEGSVGLLKDDIRRALGLSKDEIKIKPTSNQIKIRGDRVHQIRQLLLDANF